MHLSDFEPQQNAGIGDLLRARTLAHWNGCWQKALVLHVVPLKPGEVRLERIFENYSNLQHIAHFSTRDSKRGTPPDTNWLSKNISRHISTWNIFQISRFKSPCRSWAGAEADGMIFGTAKDTDQTWSTFSKLHEVGEVKFVKFVVTICNHYTYYNHIIIILQPYNHIIIYYTLSYYVYSRIFELLTPQGRALARRRRSGRGAAARWGALRGWAAARWIIAGEIGNFY